MSDSHEVPSGVSKFCAIGPFVRSRPLQASTWLQRCPTVSRRHLELVRFQGRTAAARRKPIPKFTPHWTPSTSGLGLPRWWTKDFSSPIAKGTPSKTNAKTTSPIPHGTTRILTNTRGDTNTKFRPNITNQTMDIVMSSELDTNSVNLKRIALTTSRCLCLHRLGKRSPSMLTNLPLCSATAAGNGAQKIEGRSPASVARVLLLQVLLVLF